MGLKEDCRVAFEEAQAAVIFSSNRGGKLKDACAAYEKIVKAKDQKKYKVARKELEEAIKSAQEAYDRKVIEAKAIAIAKKWATSAARPAGATALANGSSSAAMAGSPNQPSASEAMVTPSWVAEIKDVGSPIRRSAARARRLPAAARASSRVRRTDTSANSAPTKKLFAATKNRTPTSLMAALIVVPGVISGARRVSSLLAGSSMR